MICIYMYISYYIYTIYIIHIHIESIIYIYNTNIYIKDIPHIFRLLPRTWMLHTLQSLAQPHGS